jgi:hypothetical protein
VLKESEQFPANKVVQSFLELKIKELDFGQHHQNAYERVNELNDLINEYNSLKENSEEYISEQFSKERNKIDLAREKLILEINQISDRLISEVDLQEKECKAKMSTCDLPSLSVDLASIKSDLSKWEKDIKCLVVDYKLWKNINNLCSKYVLQLKQSKLECEEKLLGKPFERNKESSLLDFFTKQLTPYKYFQFNFFFIKIL